MATCVTPGSNREYSLNNNATWDSRVDVHFPSWEEPLMLDTTEWMPDVPLCEKYTTAKKKTMRTLNSHCREIYMVCITVAGVGDEGSKGAT